MPLTSSSSGVYSQQVRQAIILVPSLDTEWRVFATPYSYRRERSTPKNLQNHVSTPSPTTRQHSHQPKETMTSMNVNYWQLLKSYKTGDHTSLGHHTPSPSSLTTLTSHF